MKDDVDIIYVGLIIIIILLIAWLHVRNTAPKEVQECIDACEATCDDKPPPKIRRPGK